MRTEVARKVRAYLIDHIGDQTAPGVPKFDADAHRWHVPVLARTPKAILPVGEFVLDEQGDFVSIPDRDRMNDIIESYLERTPHLVYGDKAQLEAQGYQVVTV